METETRIAETNGDKPEDVSLDEQANRARAVLESHRQSKVQIAEQELGALLKRHGVGLQVRQMILNGMPQGVQIIIVPE